MEKYVSSDPLNIGLLCAQTVVAHTQFPVHLVEQFGIGQWNDPLLHRIMRKGA